MHYSFTLLQAITGDSVLLKFQKARSVLLKSLQHVDEIASPSISCQVFGRDQFSEDVVKEFETTPFACLSFCYFFSISDNTLIACLHIYTIVPHHYYRGNGSYSCFRVYA